MIFCEVCWVVLAIGAVLGIAYLFSKRSLKKQYKMVADEYYGLNG